MRVLLGVLGGLFLLAALGIVALSVLGQHSSLDDVSINSTCQTVGGSPPEQRCGYTGYLSPGSGARSLPWMVLAGSLTIGGSVLLAASARPGAPRPSGPVAGGYPPPGRPGYPQG